VIVVSLINSRGGAVCKLLNKRSSIPFWKKYEIIVLFNSKNGMKLAKLAKDFDIPTMMLTAVSKKK